MTTIEKNLINTTDELLSKGFNLNLADINKAMSVSNAYMKQQTLNDYKSKIFSNNTFKIFIKFHVNQHSKLGKRSDYFSLEGVENMVNIVNMYHVQNTGIAQIIIYDENKQKLFTSNYKSNYDSCIPVKKLLFAALITK